MKSVYRFGWSLVVALVCVLGPVQAQESRSLIPDRTLDIVQDSGYLNIGMYQDFPPYSYEVDGEARGVDADLGRRIAEGLGVEFRPYWIIPDENLGDDLRNHIWKGHYLAKTRIADIMMRVPYDSTFKYMRDSTGEMINEQVVFVGPYQQERWQIAFDENRLDSVETIAVFQYHPIGVEVDTLPATYLTSAFGGRLRDQVHHYSNIGAAFEALAQGEVAGVMGMRAEIEHQLEAHAGNGFTKAGNGFPGITKQVWDVGLAVRHTHRALSYAVEAIVDRMVRSGEMTELFASHGLSYSRPGYYDAILGPEESGE
ncbi:substrate-binding periplasmic protein [Marinobacter orientalis]|uniref:Transporter substrate-binding domain-containing protein n=1 Tax=Marinobacter orientalis TaxID=1928859 RepID=A0A7Y0NJG1_9GAMM|nr:transporter substrate-binding domain-containing protein [Marinobacter orientalis]NMT62313.1 transporter substrate-binding domain-containing protein [Marinobacter orientalis]TGX51020.1 transporter substrate-binding domain-containing protein [Marinobacter orientalis]